MPASGVGRILIDNLLFDRIEDAPVLLAVVATDVLSGDDVLLTAGDAVAAVLASPAIPGVFPPVTIGGRELMDGGVVNNTPISYAVALGAHCFSRTAAPTTVLGMALNALTPALNHRLAADVERYAGLVDLRVAPPLCGVSVSPADFGHADELMSRAYAQTRKWLTESRQSGHHRAGSDATVRP